MTARIVERMVTQYVAKREWRRACSRKNDCENSANSAENGRTIKWLGKNGEDFAVIKMTTSEVQTMMEQSNA